MVPVATMLFCFFDIACIWRASIKLSATDKRIAVTQVEVISRTYQEV